MNEYLTIPPSTENIKFQIEQSDENTLQPFFTNIGGVVPKLSIGTMQHKLFQDMHYGSYQHVSGSFSRNTELKIYKAFLGTTSIDFKVYDKSDVLYNLIQDEIFRFKRFVDEEITISEKILSRIVETISKLNYYDISFDLSSDLNLSARIMLNIDYLLIINIPLSDPIFFKHNCVFFSLFYSKELLISFKKEFNELIDGISTLNS